MSDIISESDSLFEDSGALESGALEESTALTEEVLDQGADAADEIGLTSEESEDSSDKKKRSLFDMSVFDAMLLLSLVFITLATLILFLELNTFGKFPGSFPWRTSEYLNLLM